MFCTKCGQQISDGVRFCPHCGQPSQPAAQETLPEPRKLMLDKSRKKVAGVCAGFARYCDVDVVLMRILWLGVALCTGVGFIVYLAAWIIIPSDEGVFSNETSLRQNF
jgi:phage shock protein C